MDDHNEGRMEEAYDEAELSDDEFEEQSFDDLLDRVKSNDPSLTKLKVRLSTLVQNNDGHQRRLVDRLSTAIGRNTQLKALRCDDYGYNVNEAQAMILFRGIACNQSIKRFRFNNCGQQLGNACRILTPLFTNNQVERVWFDDCELSINSIRLIATSLAEFDSLKEFVFSVAFHHDYQQAARDLMQALSGHSGLRKLDLSNTSIGMLGCSALVDLLSNPNINLRVLELASNRLRDDEAVALASGMAGNISLKEINLAGNMGIGQAGWQAFFDHLSSSSCMWEKFTLDDNTINDAAAQSLSNALTSNTTLKTLDLGYNRSITVIGWRVLFGFLRSPTCLLEDLGLRSNDFNDEVIESLTDVLANNRSLRSLDLSFNRRVNGDTWQRFFSTVLASPSSELEKLDLYGCKINDAAIRSLTNALVNNSKLKVLTFKGDYHIANTGWEMFSSVLESPNTALEELDLQGSAISDDTRTLLVNSLANNKKLKKLLFYHSDEWEPPLSVLCNSDSIMDTYNSNHILEELKDQDDYHSPLPEEFESLLQINRESSPSQAARLKIINTHFNRGFIAQPFVGMDLNVLPHAMAWMGRDGEVSNHFYGFIRSMAFLFEKGQQEEEE